ncbi:GGDEF domain-containing protein [Granulicella pectinivorans]|uniref:GGDEF domain-containing protein n=1 Tax=Granulicella pectinivorans TaxID=474950 RepID=UPI000B7F8DC7|nr:GGDEF domain-containing protein [Granulicella pectinivorans]
MNRVVLANTFALMTFIGSFWPLARRAGPHARVWLLGWTFLLLRNLALLFSDDYPPHNKLAHLAALWCMELCALCFIRAAGNAPLSTRGFLFLIELGLPVLSQAALFVFSVSSYGVRAGAALLCFVPLVHMLVRPLHRTQTYVVLSGGFAVLGVFSFSAARLNAEAVLTATLCAVFVSAAYLYYAGALRVTRGVPVAAAGFVGWGLSYPLAWGLAHLQTPIVVDPILLSLPQYCVAYGMILTLLEEHVGRTERLALADPLTGLANTRHFEDRFARALANTSLHGNPLACLVIDVDNFKTVNDTLGHPVGDELLKALSVRLAWHIGPRDTLARTGGDEFTAILVGEHDEHHLRFIAQAMMSAASVPLSVHGHAVPVTLSIGIAVATPETLNLAALRKAADDAMYQAKRRGGGRLAVHGETAPTVPVPSIPFPMLDGDAFLEQGYAGEALR